MSTDLSGYTFTNGTKVTDWIATLPVDDRKRATEVVREFVAERKPLNMLQVKIRMTVLVAELARESDYEKPTAAVPQSSIPPTQSKPTADAYNTPGPILPTVDRHESETPSTNRRNNHKLAKLLVIIACVILMGAIFTNPSRETHIDMLTETVARNTAKSIGQIPDSPFNMFGDIFGLSQPQFPDDEIESLVHDVLDSQLEYHNYILWSTCTAHVGTHKQTVSAGAFGLVRPLDKDLAIN